MKLLSEKTIDQKRNLLKEVNEQLNSIHLNTLLPLKDKIREIENDIKADEIELKSRRLKIGTCLYSGGRILRIIPKDEKNFGNVMFGDDPGLCIRAYSFIYRYGDVAIHQEHYQTSRHSNDLLTAQIIPLDIFKSVENQYNKYREYMILMSEKFEKMGLSLDIKNRPINI